MPENNDIPEMNLNDNYSKNPNVSNVNTGEMQKELDKTKKELEKLKNFIVKKFPFTEAIGILPPQLMKVFIEEEEIPKETEKHVQLYMVVPEDKFKEIPKIKQEIVKQIDSSKSKQKIWIQVKTPIDVFETCLDGKFELANAIAMSYPLHDKGFLGALRVAEIHKNLVLQKFERYVVSYVIAGSLVRGQAIPTSDIDVFIVINDTDVKRMPRLELKERLRGMIHQYVSEAAALAGVKNKLEPQVWLLTEFWDSVKDANPVMFTFIRDGIPLYDRGTFMPWKRLLQMGKLKPSPEAIDGFMKTADKTKNMVERRLVDAMIDVYYGVLTPSQALLMLYGLPPPTHKETPKVMEDIFVKKEKMLKKSEIEVLVRAVRNFKEYEHDIKYKIKGSEVDKLIHDSEVYVKRLKQLRVEIEKTAQEKLIEQVYDDVFNLLKTILGKKSQEKTIKDFETKLVKTGKLPRNSLKILQNIVSARKESKKGKSTLHKVDETRKNAVGLINDLVEYSQRKDLMSLEKSRMRLKYKDEGKEKIAELVVSEEGSFLVKNNMIKKITDKITDSNVQEFSESVEKNKTKQNIHLSPKIFDLLKKELGSFEIVL